MKIKVCGMKYPDNIEKLMALPIDMIGLIFYSKSPRYVTDVTKNGTIDRVGVFVNESTATILEITDKYQLSSVQLHGNESPEYCKELSKHIRIIKAFNIASEQDFINTEKYEKTCSLFLFDTKTTQYGGSGQKFDWQLLDYYHGQTPFLLSGGISADDIEAIKSIKHPLFHGVDLNSRFEIEPGLKDVSLLNQFIKEIRS